MEKGGERCNLEEEEESLRALAVEEAHILSAIVKTTSASLCCVCDKSTNNNKNINEMMR